MSERVTIPQPRRRASAANCAGGLWRPSALPSFSACPASLAARHSQASLAQPLLPFNRPRLLISCCSSRVWHSHTISTRHPALRRAAAVRRSRATFASNLSDQKRIRDFGQYENLQPAWRCQKQPCTNMMVRYIGRTMSGEPGMSFRCTRNRYPSRWRVDLTISSGRVSVPLIRDMFRLRWADVRQSTCVTHFQPVRIPSETMRAIS